MQIEKFKAKNNYVIVEYKEERQKTLESGLIVMEKARWGELMNGTIVAIADKVNLPDNITVGSKVFFFDNNDVIRSRFTLDSKEYLNIKDVDLLAYE